MIRSTETVWLLPSRRRPESLRRVFKAHEVTDTSTRGIVAIDRIDWNDNPSYASLSITPGWSFVVTEGETMGDKVRELWPLYKDAFGVGLLGDDNIPMTARWDKILSDQLTGWNIVSSDDGVNARSDINLGRMAGGTLWSCELIRSIGYLYPPKLQHSWIDDVWETIGRKAECWNVDMSVLVKHDHIAHYDRTDSTQDKQRQLVDIDYSVFLDWSNNGEVDRCIEVAKQLKARMLNRA